MSARQPVALAGPAAGRALTAALPSSVMLPGGQISLFGHDEPSFDAAFARTERVVLGGGAWLDIARGWLSGDSTLFDTLSAKAAWRAEARQMYDREVDVPRLHAVLERAEAKAVHPVIERMRVALDAEYGAAFVRTSVALYRDGRDSVAWHGDYPARDMDEDTVVATVSLGAPRTFLMRRKGGGPSRSWTLGRGDLLVMGGSCQRAYQHAIPKVTQAAPRMALMYRPLWAAR